MKKVFLFLITMMLVSSTYAQSEIYIKKTDSTIDTLKLTSMSDTTAIHIAYLNEDNFIKYGEGILVTHGTFYIYEKKKQFENTKQIAYLRREGKLIELPKNKIWQILEKK